MKTKVTVVPISPVTVVPIKTKNGHKTRVNCPTAKWCTEIIRYPHSITTTEWSAPGGFKLCENYDDVSWDYHGLSPQDTPGVGITHLEPHPIGER